MSAHPILRGIDFYDGPCYQREERHRRIINESCIQVLVTPQELGETLDYDGNVKSWSAEELVRTLIDRAHKAAVAKTLGIEST